MRHQGAAGMSRRRFLGGVTVAGTAGLLGLKPGRVAAEPPPETATIRLPHAPAVCTAPLYVAEELLRSEGFTEVHYVKSKLGRMAQVAAEQADISAVDRPWSQYFCCLVTVHREFVRKHPVATKRALRAIVKAADICALKPERVARSVVDKGITASYDYAMQSYKEIPYLNAWREFNAEDTLRFYALRLHEAGMIKSTPQTIIAQGTDWRFLKELKQELKG